MRRFILFIIIVLVAIILLLPRKQRAELIFFDVGQGDSLALRTPTGKIIIIDGGPDWSSLYGLGKWLGLSNKEIDIIILTHGHADHLSALPEIVTRYGVSRAYLPSRLDTAAAHSLLEALEQVSAEIIYPAKNFCQVLESDCYFCLYVPSNDFLNSKDENDLSLITYFNCDGLTLLASGDASVKREQELIAAGFDLPVKIFKAAHHGSNTANSQALLKLIKPVYMVISVGAGNNYGHPSSELISRALSLGIKLWRSDWQGSAHFYTNNSKIYLDEP